MKITEDFVKEILIEDYPIEFQSVYDDSLLLQYLERIISDIINTDAERRTDGQSKSD